MEEISKVDPFEKVQRKSYWKVWLIVILVIIAIIISVVYFSFGIDFFNSRSESGSGNNFSWMGSSSGSSSGGSILPPPALPS